MGEWMVRKDSIGDVHRAKDACDTFCEPVVVISPEDRESVERLITTYHDRGVTERDVDDMQAALREFANPTPPRPEEPLGLGAVVKAANGDRWTRVDSTGGDADRVWICEADDEVTPFRWGNFAAVLILSAGVTDGGGDR